MKTTSTGRITGHAIVFDTWSLDLGGFKERVRPSAVDRTLREALDVRCLVGHDSSKVVGRVKAHTLRLHKDQRGLAIVVDVPDTSNGRDIHTLVTRGDVNQMSFAFTTIADLWYLQNGAVLRDLEDMVIAETSFVTWPAYVTTSATARGELRATHGRLELSDDHTRGEKYAGHITLLKELAKGAQRCARCRTTTATRVQTRGGVHTSVCERCSGTGGSGTSATVEQRTGRRSPRAIAHKMITSGCWTWPQAQHYIRETKGR